MGTLQLSSDVEAVEKDERKASQSSLLFVGSIWSCSVPALLVPGRFAPATPLLQLPTRCQLPDVVNHGEEFPLGVNLLASSKCESVETQVASDVCEHRLHRAHSTAVVVPATLAVESLDHLSNR